MNGGSHEGISGPFTMFLGADGIESKNDRERFYAEELFVDSGSCFWHLPAYLPERLRRAPPHWMPRLFRMMATPKRLARMWTIRAWWIMRA